MLKLTMSYSPIRIDSSVSYKWIEENVEHGEFSLYLKNAFKSEYESSGFKIISEPFTNLEIAKIKYADISSEEIIKLFQADIAAERWGSLTFLKKVVILKKIVENFSQHSDLLISMHLTCSHEHYKYIRLRFEALQHMLFNATSINCSNSDRIPIGVSVFVIATNSKIEILLKIFESIAIGNSVIIFITEQNPNILIYIFAKICADAGLFPGVLSIMPIKDFFSSDAVSITDVCKTFVYFEAETPLFEICLPTFSLNCKNISFSVTKYNGSAKVFIVYESADIDCALQNILYFINVEPYVNIMVQESIYQTFIEILNYQTEKLKVGSKYDKLTDVILHDHSTESQTLLEGAKTYNFIEHESNSRIILKESFADKVGNIAISCFRTLKESVELVNSFDKNGFISIYTKNLPLALEATSLIKCDSICVNCHYLSTPIHFDTFFNVDGFDNDFEDKNSQNNFVIPICKDKKCSSAMKNQQCSKIPEIISMTTAAQKAFSIWSSKSKFDRFDIIFKFAKELQQLKQLILPQLNIETAENELEESIQRLLYWASKINSHQDKSKSYKKFTNIKKIEPIGIIGVICPEDKFPLLKFISFLAPVIAFGNSVLIHPASEFPIDIIKKALKNSGIPNGVVNFISGNKNELAIALVKEPIVRAVWFSGCAACHLDVMRKVMEKIDYTRIWNYGSSHRDFFDKQQGQGDEFMMRAVRVKNIWLSKGEIFAN